MASYSGSISYTAPELKDYEASKLPVYEAQTDKINETYDKKQESDIAALQSAYDTSLLEAEYNKSKINPTYDKAANEQNAKAENTKQNWAEYANANGLNSGTAGQGQLAIANQNLSDMNDIRVAQANAMAEAELELTKIKTAYNDNVAAAIKENDYQRALALTQEYQTQAQSVVSVAQAQAEENYKAYQSQISNASYLAEWNRTADEDAYNRALAKAETLAQYGDFSGYGDLGYSAAEIAAMKNYWNSLQSGSGSSSGSYYTAGSGATSTGSTSSAKTTTATLPTSRTSQALASANNGIYGASQRYTDSVNSLISPSTTTTKTTTTTDNSHKRISGQVQ